MAVGTQKRAFHWPKKKKSTYDSYNEKLIQVVLIKIINNFIGITEPSSFG